MVGKELLMGKAVIVDLDRTLLHTDGTLSEYTVRIMGRCHDEGILILAATARPERSILDYQRRLGFDAITVMNGARVILPDKVIENGLAPVSARRVLSRLVAIPDILISIETNEGLYSNAAIPEWNARLWNGFPDLPTQGTVFKILASSQSDDLYGRVGGMLTEDTYYTVANHKLVQIMSRKATKWNGVQAMLGALRISRADTVYFGDDHDDIEPIRMCGLGVAVSNAIKEVIKVADHVTGSNDEDGVACFLETYLSSSVASHQREKT